MAISQPQQTASFVSTADTICCFILWEGRKEGRKITFLLLLSRIASPQSLLSSALDVWSAYTQILPYGNILPWTSS